LQRRTTLQLRTKYAAAFGELTTANNRAWLLPHRGDGATRPALAARVIRAIGGLAPAGLERRLGGENGGPPTFTAPRIRGAGHRPPWGRSSQGQHRAPEHDRMQRRVVRDAVNISDGSSARANVPSGLLKASSVGA
jgi:hypothetical protein